MTYDEAYRRIFYEHVAVGHQQGLEPIGVEVYLPRIRRPKGRNLQVDQHMAAQPAVLENEVNSLRTMACFFAILCTVLWCSMNPASVTRYPESPSGVAAAATHDPYSPRSVRPASRWLPARSETSDLGHARLDTSSRSEWQRHRANTR